MKKRWSSVRGGWLGARLVERLAAEGRGVLCVDVFLGEDVRKLPGIEVIEADIRNTELYRHRMAECSAVFNCAGLLHPGKTSEIYAVNRDAPVAVFKACMEQGVDSFVHVSSINAQGENPTPNEFLDETTPLRPITHYGISKAEGEVALKALVVPGSTRLIMLRPGVFYGERPSKNLREFMEKLQSSRMPLFSKRGMLRTYVDVDKVVEAMLLAEHRGRSGEAYLIGDAAPLSTLRFYEVVAEELGVKPKIVHVPLVAASLCGGWPIGRAA